VAIHDDLIATTVNPVAVGRGSSSSSRGFAVANEAANSAVANATSPKMKH
jgi:hypothetical protein